MKKPSKYSCKFPNFVKKVPGYNWYQGLDKRQKTILMHAVLATGGAGVAISGCFAAAATGSFAEVWGTTSTGAFLVGRNLWQAWQIATRGEADISIVKGQQALRKNLAITSAVSAGGYAPQLLEGMLLQDPIRIATAGSAALAYSISTYRYTKAYRTRKEDYQGEKFIPGRWTEKLPGNLLITRGICQTGLAYQFYQTYGPLAGATLGLATLIQTTGAIVKKDADTIIYKCNDNNSSKPKPPNL